MLLFVHFGCDFGAEEPTEHRTDTLHCRCWLLFCGRHRVPSPRSPPPPDARKGVVYPRSLVSYMCLVRGALNWAVHQLGRRHKTSSRMGWHAMCSSNFSHAPQGNDVILSSRLCSVASACDNVPPHRLGEKPHPSLVICHIASFDLSCSRQVIPRVYVEEDQRLTCAVSGGVEALIVMLHLTAQQMQVSSLSTRVYREENDWPPGSATCCPD